MLPIYFSSFISYEFNQQTFIVPANTKYSVNKDENSVILTLEGLARQMTKITQFSILWTYPKCSHLCSRSSAFMSV